VSVTVWFSVCCAILVCFVQCVVQPLQCVSCSHYSVCRAVCSSCHEHCTVRSSACFVQCVVHGVSFSACSPAYVVQCVSYSELDRLATTVR
jgi:hypothetical protein